MSEFSEDPKRIKSKEFAGMCVAQGEEMAVYTFEMASSCMWASLAEKYLLPRAEKVHSMLVELGATEENKLDFNDGDDRAFYIPVEGYAETWKTSLGDHTNVISIKVFVHTTQNVDYLYVINESFGLKTLHIRRIWRNFTKEMCEEMKGSRKDVTHWAIANAVWLGEYTDYPRSEAYERKWRCDRPGLETYRDLGFRIPNVAEPFSQVNMYGDARDKGYILSYKQESEYMKDFVKAEHVGQDAGIILSCYLPSLVSVCEEELEEKRKNELA